MAATRIKTQDIADAAITTAKINDHAVTGIKLGILTTKGDLLAFSTVADRLPVGSNGTALLADSTQATGLAWGAAGLQTTNFVHGEVPTGSVDGVNAAFTLANTPTAGTLRVFKNGIRQKIGAGNDYTLAAAVVTFEAGNLPQTGDVLLCDYMK